jgi:hypothetical protein
MHNTNWGWFMAICGAHRFSAGEAYGFLLRPMWLSICTCPSISAPKCGCRCLCTGHFRYFRCGFIGNQKHVRNLLGTNCIWLSLKIGYTHVIIHRNCNLNRENMIGRGNSGYVPCNWTNPCEWSNNW